MPNALFEKGREGFLDGSIDFDTDTIKLALLDLGTADTGIKLITGCTNATPIVVTSNSHGFANGDIVHIQGVGGTTAANNVWTVANQATNTFELSGSIGNGNYTSGGVAVNMGISAAGDMWEDFDGAVIGTPATLASKTVAGGVADAADVTFTAVTGNSVEALAIFKDTGTPSTSRMIAFLDGKHRVTCNTTAASSATSIFVEPLAAGIASGQVLIFSTPASATLSASAAAGDRVLTVSALAAQITAGSFATANATSSGLPVTPNGGNINVTFDSGVNRIWKL